MKTRFAFNAHAKANDRAFWPSKMSVKLAIWLRGFFLISNDPTCNKINRKNLHFLGVNYVPSEHSGLRRTKRNCASANQSFIFNITYNYNL
jgi:hypothetical protein